MNIINYINYISTQYKVFRSNESLKLYNFFPLPKDLNWFYYFMKHRGIDKKINLFSVFGNRKLIKLVKGKKIFYSGEYLQQNTINPKWKQYADHCIEEVDLALGYDYIEHPNYLRLPIWVLFFVRPDTTYEDVKQKINIINNPNYRLNNKKTDFACLIARHDISGIRKKIWNAINPIDTITCPGKFLNNTIELSDMERQLDNRAEKPGEFNFDSLYTLKKEYLKKFEFNICAENANGKGYISEKLFDAIEGACIPIYWGGGQRELIEPEVINPEAFLYYEEGKENELTSSVKILYENNKQYNSFIKIPPFKETAAEYIWELLNSFENKLKSL